MTTTVLDFEPTEVRGTEDTKFSEQALLVLLEDAGRERPASRSLAKLIAQILVATTSHAVRDAAALALIDLDAKDEIDALIAVIGRPGSAGHNGTPLFALDELGGSLPLRHFVQMIEQGSYESIAEAVILLREGRITSPADRKEVDAIQERLKALTRADDPVIAEAAFLAVAHLP